MDLIDREAAIDAINKALSRVFTEPCGEQILKDLPSAQPEPPYCEYCHEDSDGYVKPIEKNCHAFISFGMDGWELSLKANGWHGSAKIRYCPMCGRRLKR